AKRCLNVFDDDRVPDDGAHERFLFWREAERIDQPPDDAIDRGEGSRRATRHVRGVARDDRRPSLASRGELGEERDAAIEVLDDDVLEVASEQPRERARELGWGFDAIGQEADERLVL